MTFVEVLGARLEILDIPATRQHLPEIVLLHEGLGSVSMWRDFPRALSGATGCRVVAYSREGFGRSSPRRKPFGLRFMHEEAFETLPALRGVLAIERPMVVGHSTGASMALLHASNDAWPVAAVLAMAPLVTIEPSNLASIRNAAELWRTTDWRGKLARHHDDVDAVFRGWNETWLDPAFARWSIEEDLAGIRCPITAIVGEDDEYSSMAQLELVRLHAVNAAGVEAIYLPHCGHAPHRDRPGAVVDSVKKLLSLADPGFSLP